MRYQNAKLLAAKNKRLAVNNVGGLSFRAIRMYPAATNPTSTAMLISTKGSWLARNWSRNKASRATLPATYVVRTRKRYKNSKPARPKSPRRKFSTRSIACVMKGARRRLPIQGANFVRPNYPNPYAQASEAQECANSTLKRHLNESQNWRLPATRCLFPHQAGSRLACVPAGTRAERKL